MREREGKKLKDKSTVERSRRGPGRAEEEMYFWVPVDTSRFAPVRPEHY